MGVQTFFVLSGFLITGILYDTRNDPHRFRNFYARRTLRIFPLYYGVLIVLAAAVYLTHGTAPPGFWMWFVYLQNFWWIATHGSQTDILVTHSGAGFAAIGHLWSLAVEEQFYLLWPVLIFRIRDRRRLIQMGCLLILLRVVLAALLEILLPHSMRSLGVVYRMLPTQWDAFVMGALVALRLRGEPDTRMQKKSGPLAIAAIAAYAVILTATHVFPQLIHREDSLSYTSAFQTVLGMPLCNAVSALLLLAAITPGTWACRLFRLPPLRSLGRVSYGLYVYHLILWVMLDRGTLRTLDHLHIGSHQNGFKAILVTMITIAVSYASFHWYEAPFIRLKNRFMASSARAAGA